MTRLVVATRSQHKLQEIRRMLGGTDALEIVDLEDAGVPESPVEDDLEAYETFEANALAKARYFMRKTGSAVLADDSGLCVDALDGAPGVRSKRFSGRTDVRGAALDRANNALLLARLADVPLERRAAHYACAVAIVTPSGRESVHHGRCDGRILTEPHGTGGFGYDPLFLSDELGITFAEATPDQKNRVSHRARALAAARADIAAL